MSVGKPLYVPCKAIGSPDATIDWRKVGDDSVTLGSELRFASTNQQDAGYYECRAKNGNDKDLVARIKVGVMGKYLSR